MMMIMGPKNLKQRYKQAFGVSVSFFSYCHFFDLLTMFIDSTTKITPHSLANVTWGSFFALIHTGPRRR